VTLVRDRWAELRRYTPARVGLGRTGISLPTERNLELLEALALARDAVRADFEPEAIAADLRTIGMEAVECWSAAPDRATYLRRPDLGRQLAASSRAALVSRRSAPVDLALVVADGLSAAASSRHSVPLLGALRELLARGSWELGPVVLVHQGRVAIGDEVATAFGASAVVVLIGERPGLSAVDSLGAYVTWAPRGGRRDAERNCISNIREGGLSIADASQSLSSLLVSARAHQLSGVALSQALARSLRSGAGTLPGAVR
jgi:ethanolamine ammonia-lyase small subunit